MLHHLRNTIHFYIMLTRSVRGDSGCWIINPENGDLYGHIVAGCSESQVGYLVPAYRIFRDIKRQLGGTIRLAAKNPTLRTDAPSLYTRDEATSMSSNAFHDPSMLVGMNMTDEEMIRYLRIENVAFADMAVSLLLLFTVPYQLKEPTD
jgi:hypothetical protein